MRQAPAERGVVSRTKGKLKRLLAHRLRIPLLQKEKVWDKWALVPILFM